MFNNFKALISSLEFVTQTKQDKVSFSAVFNIALFLISLHKSELLDNNSLFNWMILLLLLLR